MRRILFILFLCVHGVAWGQIPYEYRYWYDGDETTAKSGTSASSAWQLRLDVSDLDNTFHMLYFQVKDTADVWSAPLSRCFVKLPLQGESTVTYWFDNAPSRKYTLQATTGTTTIDVSGLSDGMHFLHLVAGNPASPHSSLVKTAVFWKQAIPTQCKYRLWVDDDASSMQEGVYTGQPIEVNVEAASDGFHLLRAQVEGSAASSPLTSMFIKVPQTKGVDRLTCIFLVDGKEYKKESVPAEGGVVKWTFDAQGISHGLHKAQAMVVTPSGAATAVKDAFFYRAMTTAEKGAMRCFYSIDGSEHRMEAGRLDNNLFHFDLDVAEVPDGFHRISYMLMGENGTSSKVMSAFFFKTALGGNGVMQYDYWLNENEANTRKVKLDKRENPFKLISLLPVETCPIRSAKFHFEVEDGQPVLYAKNDFHVRFYDASSRATEATKDYVDYQVRRPVEDIEVLGPLDAGTVRCGKPAENDIRWFKLEAKIGDSLAIKTSKAATLQIFSPTGKEVYRTEGAGSVEYGGCHAYEDGTHYVALHDVTASNVTTLDLSYQRIAKYAVLECTPNEVGITPGYMHVELFGNGYDKLKGATLLNGTEVLKADTFEVEGISNATIEFFIANTEMPRGKYDLVLEFEEDGTLELLTLEKVINMVDPVHGDIQIKISSQRRTAKPYPVTIEVTNTGNVAYQMIPLYIGFDNPHKVEEVYAMNFGIYLSEENLNDSVPVPTFIETNNLLNKGVEGFVLPTMIPKLDAHETIELQLGFVSGPHATFKVYAWNYRPWGLYNLNASVGSAPPLVEREDNFTCEFDPCEEIGHFVPNLAECACGIAWGNISTFAGIYLGIRNKWVRQMNNHYGADLDYFDLPRYKEVKLRSPGDILRGVIGHCVHIPNEALQGIFDATINLAEDACPDPKPHSVNVYMPGDPNDIKGYTAASGSKSIAKGVTDAYYAIEFENDPEIANAPAHHIIIKDTLDGTYLDLESFTPTSIKFGKKDIRLDGEQSFVQTVDLRPEIDVIAQLSLDYDAKKGIATWDFLALDPMSMEPTDHLMQGILPVNNDAGDGQGEVTFDIKLKEGLDDGVVIENRAAIIFEKNAPIITPTWTNVTDTVAPTSEITACEMVNDSTMTLRFKGTDNRSGVWTYDLYVQDGPETPWQKVAESIADSVYEFKGYTGIDYGFCVMATDSAGNYELKALARELTQPTYKKGDANGDGVVNTTDAMLAIDKYLGNTVYLNVPATDVNGDGIINTNDAMLIQEIYLNTSSAKMKTKAVRRRLKTNNL